MIYYWIFSYLALMALLECMQSKNARFKIYKPDLIIFLFFLVFFVGCRNEVGADWDNYVYMYQYIGEVNFWDAMARTEVGYALLNILSYHLSGGIYLVNSLVAILMVWGITKCVQYEHPNKWLFFVLIYSYIIIIVGMGYSRQVVAVTAIYCAFFVHGGPIKFLLFVLAGALFHYSALIFLFIPIIQRFISANIAVFIVQIVVVFFLGLMLVNSTIIDLIEGRFDFYISANLQSSGFYPRLINILFSFPFFILLYKRNYFDKAKELGAFYFLLSAMLPFSLLSTTLVDRFLPYFYLVFIAVFLKLKLFFKRDGWVVYYFLLIIYQFFQLMIWLELSDHATSSWLPYSNVIFR